MVVLESRRPAPDSLAFGILDPVLDESDMLDRDELVRAVLGDDRCHPASPRSQKSYLLPLVPRAFEIRTLSENRGPDPVSLGIEHDAPDLLGSGVDSGGKIERLHGFLLPGLSLRAVVIQAITLSSLSAWP